MGHKGQPRYRNRKAEDPEFPDALCASPDYDPDLWHMEQFEDAVRAAQKICRRCPELSPCVVWGTSPGAPRDGVIGGLTGDRRAEYRRSRLNGWQ